MHTRHTLNMAAHVCIFPQMIIRSCIDQRKTVWCHCTLNHHWFLHCTCWPSSLPAISSNVFIIENTVVANATCRQRNATLSETTLTAMLRTLESKPNTVTHSQYRRHRHAWSWCQRAKHSCDWHPHTHSLPTGVKLCVCVFCIYRIRYRELTGVY